VKRLGSVLPPHWRGLFHLEIVQLTPIARAANLSSSVRRLALLARFPGGNFRVADISDANGATLVDLLNSHCRHWELFHLEFVQS